MQHRFKMEEVDGALMAEVEKNQATNYFIAMAFQLGCAIGELIAMGVNPESMIRMCTDLTNKAVGTRVSVNTKDS